MARLISGEKLELLFQELLNYYRIGFVGRRVNEIIHSVNTPLQIILTQSELMERHLQEEQDKFASNLPPPLLPEWQQFFHYRQKKNKQLQEVTHDLQNLMHILKQRTAHEAHRGIQEIELNSLLLEALSGYEAKDFYRYRVTKKFQWFEPLPPISGLYVDFSQTFCNLIDNALEALHEVVDPVLSVTTRMAAGRRIIAVGDNGPGIPEAIQGEIFTPCFTTKISAGRPHAGLSLFLSRRLLLPYGGEITFESRPGETVFRIILP